MLPSSLSRWLFALVVPIALPAQSTRASLVARIDSIASAPVGHHIVAGMAVEVVRGSDTLLDRGYGFADLENDVPVTPRTVFRIGSITKQFTSSAVMQLVEQGKINLDDDITKYLPQVQTHGRRMPLRVFLNHTSGIPSYTDVGLPFARISRLDLPHDSLYAIVAHDSLLFEPGTHFYYNNTGYFLLGMLLERVTGEPYGQYLDERLFKPNSLSSTTYCDTRRIIPHRAQGYTRTPRGFENSDYIGMDLPFAAGSLCSTVGDLVRWTSELSGGKVVDATSYHAMTTPVRLPSGRPMNYGYGLEVDSIGGREMISHGGGINGFISYLLHVPSESLTVAVLSNTSPAPSQQVAMSIARVILGVPEPAAMKLEDLAVNAADRKGLEGDYLQTLPDGSRRPVRVLEENEHLLIQFGGQRPMRLDRQSDGSFLIPGGAGRLTFDISNDRATGFVLGGGARFLEALRVR